MYKAMKALAIAALIVTILGALAVLYGINTLSPVVEQATVTATPAAQAQSVFDGAMDQIAKGTFAGSLSGESLPETAQDCTFLTYTVRLKNRGFFPAEWISLRVQMQPGDVLQLANDQANVLPAGGAGDISATILHAGDASNAARTLQVGCYVFGRQIAFDVSVN